MNASQRRGPAATLRDWWPNEAADAVRVSLAAIAAIWLSMALEFEAPHWAGWTVISVTLATRAASLRKSLWRAGSTIVGVSVAIVLTANFAQATLAFDIAIALWLGLLTAASTIESGQRSYGFALMGFTVPIVAFADVAHPERVFATGVDRCSTILLGIACAYAANVPVAPDVPAVGRVLADRLSATADACAGWLAAAAGGHADPGPMPSAEVTALDEAVVDAFTEQPSLRYGGCGIDEAAPRLRGVLAAGLLRFKLPDRTGARSTTLLASGPTIAARQIARVRVAARLLRDGGRIGRRRVAFRARLLLWNDRDWDGRGAVNNGLRTIATVSLVNAFWYATGWNDGASAATWAGLLAVLLAARPDPVAAARAFFIGVPIAVAVGLFVRYGVLTTTGAFPLLAAVLMPVCMLAVVGRSDARAVYGVGYGFLVLGFVAPTNVMTYDLAASVNQIVAESLGMGVAIVAFAALPPPADAAALRRRARGRIVGAVRAAALDPAFALPPRDRYLARGFGRLALAVQDADARHDAQTLFLVGLLLLALRETDDRLGRAVGRLAWGAAADPRSSAAGDDRAALAALATDPDTDRLQGERIAAVAALLATLDLGVGTEPPAGRWP